MSQSQPSIDRFVVYVQDRGIEKRFEPLYRAVAQDLLRRFTKPSLDMIDASHVKRYLEEEELRLTNLRIVGVALEAYFQERPKRPGPPRPPSPRQRLDRLPVPSQPPDRQSPPQREEPEPPPESVRVGFVRDVIVAGALGAQTASELSVNGMYLDMGGYTPVGSVLRISFALEPGQRPIRVQVRVVHEDPGGGVDVVFVDLDPADRARIQRFVESATRR